MFILLLLTAAYMAPYYILLPLNSALKCSKQLSVATV